MLLNLWLETPYIFSCMVVCDLRDVNQRLAWQLYNRDIYRHKDDINVICELLAVRHGDLEIDLFINSVLDAFMC